MRALQEFIAQKNHWNSFFNGEQYEIKTAKGRQRVADMIDAALSERSFASTTLEAQTQVGYGT